MRFQIDAFVFKILPHLTTPRHKRMIQRPEVTSKEQNEKLHVLFFTASLGGGGAEMHLLRLLNHLNRERFQLSLAVVKSGGSYESALATDVKVCYLETGNFSSSTLRTIRAIKPLHQLIQSERPHILCSVLELPSIAALLAVLSLRARPKVVLCVQNTLSVQYQNPWHLVNRSILALIPRLYPYADKVVALSQGVAEDLKRLVPKIGDRATIIYNAGFDERVLQQAEEPLPIAQFLPRPLIVACGRLTPQKGFSYLLEAFVRVRQSIPAYLWIIGEGKERQKLEKQLQRFGLADCVSLLGFQPNPYQYIATADVFVLSSLFEGFGNVIVEAMACGTPVVATNCPSGPGEIITNGVNGILVPPANTEVLAKAILQVLNSCLLQQQLSVAGKERAWDFQAKTIALAYEQLFLSLV